MRSKRLSGEPPEYPSGLIYYRKKRRLVKNKFIILPMVFQYLYDCDPRQFRQNFFTYSLVSRHFNDEAVLYLYKRIDLTDIIDPPEIMKRLGVYNKTIGENPKLAAMCTSFYIPETYNGCVPIISDIIRRLSNVKCAQVTSVDQFMLAEIFRHWCKLEDMTVTLRYNDDINICYIHQLDLDDHPTLKSLTFCKSWINDAIEHISITSMSTKAEVRGLEDQYETLKTEHETLNAKYDTLKVKYGILKAKYEALKSKLELGSHNMYMNRVHGKFEIFMFDVVVYIVIQIALVVEFDYEHVRKASVKTFLRDIHATFDALDVFPALSHTNVFQIVELFDNGLNICRFDVETEDDSVGDSHCLRGK
ncbi:hypothetical protein BC938DRAFT_473784 [Jimgerdemannia flammicorona]|uniref:Uncharacterized protein n=1 Tax=Jimgerdemannia flammicorona TaxID=994334 RepID=A0A433QZN7_9FUNG|nr:hypothetical protein BC938DRAFT_473784 [Jimgerdemannia flammicorona]